MDWVSVAVAVALALLGVVADSKKKKKQSEQTENKRKTAARTNAQRKGQARQSASPYHSPAESAKEKGVSLDEFRRRFEQAANDADELIRDVRRTAADGVEGASMEGKPTLPYGQKVKPRQSSHPTPKAVPQVTVKADLADKKPAVTVTVTPAAAVQTAEPQTNGAYERAAAVMANRKYTPMQQAFLWSEILGAPKAKRKL